MVYDILTLSPPPPIKLPIFSLKLQTIFLTDIQGHQDYSDFI